MNEESHFAIELTPMIDVVFLLIVFFLVATTFQQMERELEVSVPQSETAGAGENGPEPIIVNVLEDGRVVVHGNAVTLDQLQTLVGRTIAEREDRRAKAVIRAHSKLAWERVIGVADACRLADKDRVSVAFATLDIEGENR